MPIAALADQAQTVARGKVAAVTCQRDASGRIFTRVELVVQEVWKGSVTGARLTVVRGGGVLGRERVAVMGQAEYCLDEEVVVFVVLNERGEGVTLSLAQGKFRVYREQGSGRELAFNPFHGTPQGLSRAAAGSDRIAAASAGSDRAPAGSLSVAELKTRVLERKP
jgi:hypothetical protein